jgi:predicted phosphodiesterase
MRIAVVSDIHGNRTAFEAVLADLRYTAPDLVFHGGDLADTGASPVEVVDHIRSLGWQGVVGNTDQMLAMPETFEDFAGQLPNLQSLWAVLREMAAASREALGEERLAWLCGLPLVQMHGPIALVHASPASPWRAPGVDASDDALQSLYGPLGQPVAVYGHIHCAYIRGLSGLKVANAGSVGLPYDGDRRASYLLIDEVEPEIRRVEYDISKEIKNLRGSSFPHAEWVVRTLESSSPQMP